MDAVDVFRHKGKYFAILQETERSQVGVMTIGPGREAGPVEAHAADQVFLVLEGEAEIRVSDQTRRVGPGHSVLVPARTPHHVRSVGEVPLFFYTVYAPPAY